MSPRELLTAGAQLTALCAFALSQPIFDLLSRNAEFFAVRGSESGDIVLFAIALTILPPLTLLGLEAIAALVDRRLRFVLHLVFVAGLVGLFAAQALERAVGPGTLQILAGTALVVAFAVAAYCRFEPVRGLLTILAPASLLFLALFLFFSPVTRLVFPPTPEVAAVTTSEARPGAPPIIFVVLDELPVMAVTDRSGKIDPVRYPNLAALAGDATLYRNATTVSYDTVKAVPALLTGMRPKLDLLPVFADHPRNLFTLLRGKYRLNVHEAATHLCPQSICLREADEESLDTRMSSLFSDVSVLYAHIVAPPSYERRLPNVTTGWGDFLSDDAGGGAEGGELDQWTSFLASLDTGERPVLNFLHLLLPHGPWRLFPSCRSNVFGDSGRHTPGLPAGDLRWQKDDWLVSQSHQRFLLQVQCVDALVGQLTERLRRLGEYDRSLIVVASDHGVSVRPGQLRRRVEGESPTNLADIAFPLMLVKRPGQDEGEVADRHVETIDLVPTIAEIAGVPLPWEVDGRPVSDERRGPDQVRILGKDVLVTAPLDALVRARDALVDRQLGMFGEGEDEPGIFGIGPHPELIGQRVAAATTTAATGLEVTLAGEVRSLLRNLPQASPTVPSPVYGSLEGDGAGSRLPIAIAVNGRFAAVSWTDGGGSATFSALLPEESFRPGRNRVEVFLIREDSRGLALASLGRF
jgi:sulfatase-like protein